MLANALETPAKKGASHLSGTVDKVLALNGASVCLHSCHMALLQQDMVDRGAFMDLHSLIHLQAEGRNDKNMTDKLEPNWI